MRYIDCPTNLLHCLRHNDFSGIDKQSGHLRYKENNKYYYTLLGLLCLEVPDSVWVRDSTSHRYKWFYKDKEHIQSSKTCEVLLDYWGMPTLEHITKQDIFHNITNVVHKKHTYYIRTDTREYCPIIDCIMTNNVETLLLAQDRLYVSTVEWAS